MIIVEGHDGSGKTSFCDHLHSTLNESHRVDLLKFPSRLPSEDDKRWVSSRVLFYLNDFEYQMHPYRDGSDYPKEAEVLIIDRSYLSTLVYQGYLKDSVFKDLDTYDTLNHMGKEIFFSDIKGLEIDIVFLECKAEIAVERILERADTCKDDVETLAPEAMLKELRLLKDRYQRLRHFLKNNPWKAHDIKPAIFHVDTSRKSTREAVEDYLKEQALVNRKGDGV